MWIRSWIALSNRIGNREWDREPLNLSVDAFSMKVLIEDTIFISPSGDQTTLPFYLVI